MQLSFKHTVWGCFFKIFCCKVTLHVLCSFNRKDFRITVKSRSGAGCSKLTTLLVKETLKFQTLIAQIPNRFCRKNLRSFCSAKASRIFSTKNFSVFDYKVIKHLTSWPLNELVKLTMLWTTGPRTLTLVCQDWWNACQLFCHILFWWSLEHHHLQTLPILCWWSPGGVLPYLHPTIQHSQVAQNNKHLFQYLNREKLT